LIGNLPHTDSNAECRNAANPLSATILRKALTSRLFQRRCASNRIDLASANLASGRKLTCDRNRIGLGSQENVDRA
jgi:hypothetical protein